MTVEDYDKRMLQAKALKDEAKELQERAKKLLSQAAEIETVANTQAGLKLIGSAKFFPYELEEYPDAQFKTGKEALEFRYQQMAS